MGAEKKSKGPKEQKAQQSQASNKKPAGETETQPEEKTSDDPYVAVVQKAVRKHAKKLERIKQTKEKAATGVKLLDEQEKLVAQEPEVREMYNEVNSIMEALKKVVEEKEKEGPTKSRPLIQLCYLLCSFAPAAEAARQRLPQLGLSAQESESLHTLLTCAESRPYAAFEAAVSGCEAFAEPLETVVRRIDEAPPVQEPPKRPPPEQYHYDGASADNYGGPNYGAVELGGQEYAPVHFGSWEAPAEQAPQDLGAVKPSDTGDDFSEPKANGPNGTAPRGDGRKGEDGRKGKSGKGKGKDGKDKGKDGKDGDKGGYKGGGSQEKGDPERKGKGKGGGKGKGKSEGEKGEKGDKGAGKGKSQPPNAWGANQQQS